VARFSLNLPLVAVAAIVLPLLFMDGALASANVAKFFVSGPVLLSYPSNTAYALQTEAAVGAFGPVPQNAWVAMVPLMIAVLGFAAMASWLWGRRKSAVDAARLSAFVLAAAKGDHARQEPLEELSLETSQLTVSPSALQRELESIRGGSAGGDPPSRADTLAAALISLAQRRDGRGLARPDAVGVYLSSGASFWDTEASKAASVEAAPLELPKAMLRAVTLEASLPALSIILEVRLDQTVPYVRPPQRRAEARTVGGAGDGGNIVLAQGAQSPVGVYHVILRFGFAEEPTSKEGEIVNLLAELGVDDDSGALKPLAHARCSLGHCKCRSLRASPADAMLASEHLGVSRVASGLCAPVAFYLARDALANPSGWEFLPCTLYNALLALSSGRGVALGLGEGGGACELAGSVDLSKLRRRGSKGTPVVEDGEGVGGREEDKHNGLGSLGEKV
jgi:hypothetical protein